MNIKSKIKWWVFPSLLWPILIGIFILLKLSINTQIERFNNDPAGVSIMGILLITLFFIAPLIPFTFMYTYELLNNEQLVLRNFVFRKTRTLNLNDIRKTEVKKGIYGLIPSTCFTMIIETTKGGTFRIGSKLNTNYELISEVIAKTAANRR